MGPFGSFEEEISLLPKSFLSSDCTQELDFVKNSQGTESEWDREGKERSYNASVAGEVVAMLVSSILESSNCWDPFDVE